MSSGGGPAVAASGGGASAGGASTAGAAAAPVLRLGFLFKQGRLMGAWKKAWYELTADALLQYKQPGDPVAEKTISLGACVVEDVPETSGARGARRRFQFALRGLQRDHVFAATSEEDRSDWVYCIRSRLYLSPLGAAGLAMVETPAQSLQQQQQQQQQVKQASASDAGAEGDDASAGEAPRLTRGASMSAVGGTISSEQQAAVRRLAAEPLSTRAVSELRTVFVQYSNAGQGCVTYSQFAALLGLRPFAQNLLIRRLFKLLDVQNTALLSCDDVVVLLQCLVSTSHVVRYTFLFTLMDLNGDGVLDERDLASTLGAAHVLVLAASSSARHMIEQLEQGSVPPAAVELGPLPMDAPAPSATTTGAAPSAQGVAATAAASAQVGPMLARLLLREARDAVPGVERTLTLDQFVQLCLARASSLMWFGALVTLCTYHLPPLTTAELAERQLRMLPAQLSQPPAGSVAELEAQLAPAVQ